jgi:hypothetical protein
MNSPEHIHDARSRDERLSEMAQRPADELVEIETANLELPTGGADGTAIGLGKN